MKYRLKYYSLDKIDKKKLLEEFRKDERGNAQIKRLKRLFVIGILCLFFSIYMIVSNTGMLDLISGITLLIAGLLFIICSYRIRIRDLNNFLIKKKK